jgi:serine/threonine-protein kinase HipA
MLRARIYNFGEFAGYLIKKDNGYSFLYDKKYIGQPISLSMPKTEKEFLFKFFPPFFDGLLPEGVQLDALLRQTKLDRNDYLSQLIVVGKDLVGSVTVEADK